MVRMTSPLVRRGSKVCTGRGFSIGELKEVNLNPREARHLGIPVDLRRRTVHPENIESLREWVEEAKRENIRFPRPKQSSKNRRGRVYRGLTSSGKKMRGLRKT